MRGVYPETYIKFIVREEWFEKMFFKVSKHFQKDKSLPTKVDRIHSYWKSVYLFSKGLLADLLEKFAQTDLNGTQNLWIIKPGGLSRGRNIRIFDNYAGICQYTNIPF